MAGLNCEIRWETRLCEVDGELGYFHCWEHWSNVIDASPLRGGHPGGQIGQIYGIVEFKDGVRRIDPAKIKFCDDENAILVWRRWRNTIAPVNRRVSNESLYFIE
jgi:hypothetical protein